MRSVPGAALVLVVVGAGVVVGALDLHRVNWATATLPGRVCGVSHPIRLHRGKARVSPRLEVNAAWHPVAFGDLDGDGLDEAAVSVACSNGGGTADSVHAYAEVVFRAGIHSPVVIGVLRPRWQPRHELSTLLTVVLRRDRVIGREAFYGPGDGTCCPTGRARTVWTYRHGTLHLTTTRVTKKPA